MFKRYHSRLHSDHGVLNNLPKKTKKAIIFLMNFWTLMELWFWIVQFLQITSEYISEDKGYASKVYRITINFAENQFSCILKVPACDTFTHNKECRFFQHFSNSGLPMPKCYASKEMPKEDDKEAFILMEDLSSFHTLHGDAFDFTRPLQDDEVRALSRF